MRLFLRLRCWSSIGLLFILTSCLSMGKISIQVSMPPLNAIPNEIQSVVLMNRSMTDSFSNLNQDSLENLFIQKKLVLDQLLLDSLAADTTLKALGNAMYESGRFDVMIPQLRNLTNGNLSHLTKSPPLRLPEVNQICNEFKADALICLENFYEHVSSSYQIGYDRMTEYGSTKEYTIFIQIAYHSKWKLYQPGEKLKVAGFEVKDTIYWERTGTTLQETYEKLPTIKEALLSGAVENGQAFSGYISPGWQEQKRSYFITNNKEADKAIGFINDNNWKEAENIWMKFANEVSTALRSQVQYNLALSAEMNGDLKGAVQWAEKSFKSKYSKAAEDYIKLLNNRLKRN